MARFILAVPLATLFCTSQARTSTTAKWLIVSAPRAGEVAYKKIGSDGGFLSNNSMQSLISVGLVHPQGLAIDQRTSQLLIADPDSKQILAYKLTGSGDTLTAELAQPVMRLVEARWVAVDGLGNIYATDEPSNRVLKISAAQVDQGDTTPSVLYDGLSLSQVSGPGGIAVDNFYTYWVNKQIGTQAGSLIKGSTVSQPTSLLASVETLARNTDKSYGICAALDNIYYTQPEGLIFGVKKTGSHESSVHTITSQLKMPRGCAWDGEETIYVADRAANAVFSFAGNMPSLQPALLQKAVDFEDAFGVAVFSKSVRHFIATGVSTLLIAWNVLG